MGCGLIPIDQFKDHMFCHEAQTELIPLATYTNEPVKKRGKREAA